MKIMAFNGSPRKAWNTATLLDKALKGAASQGAETSLIHLYDLDYQGCKSCFACKTRGGKSHGKCASRDALTPILEQALQADALLLGSPLYFWAVTGEMKSFMERLMFPLYRYAKDDDPVPTLFPRTIPTGFIYTMGAPEDRMAANGFTQAIALNEMFLKRVFGKSESMVSCDTSQFDDYDKIDQERFDVAKKAARKAEVFPQDCKRAFDLGARMASGA